jgi:hypothetical protein
MFQIRIFTPPALDESGWRHAGGELTVGDARMIFFADLTYWNIGDYQCQWREAVGRLMQGEQSAALMTAYGGPDGASHTMWALWLESDEVYVQGLTLLTSELDAAFNPNEPHAHLGTRVPVGENALPIPEWCFDRAYLHTAKFGSRWANPST